MDLNSRSPLLNESSEAVERWAGVLAASSLFIVCLISNVLLIISVRNRMGFSHRDHRNNCNVANLISLIAGVSIFNGCITCLVQITSFLVGSWIFSNTFCKIQGLTTNLMSLLIIWYKALLGFERYLKFVKPQEYDVTFSKLNMQIILFGISFVLLSAVSGPIYGWGDYAYLHDIHFCSFDLQARNAVTYFVLSSLSYVVTPYLILAYSCLAVLFSGHGCSNHRYSPPLPHEPWNSLERKDIILPLSVDVIISLVMVLPKYVVGIKEALDPKITFNPQFLYAACWLQTFGINCSFPCLLLTYHIYRYHVQAHVPCSALWRSGSSITSGEMPVPGDEAVISLSHKRCFQCTCWSTINKNQQKPILLSQFPPV